METCLKCSAKTLNNLSDIIFYADRSYNYPSSPLYDRSKNVPMITRPHSQCLRDPVKCILRRIFRIFNRSHSLYLSDDELAEFQVRFPHSTNRQYFCYGSTLTSENIARLKEMLRKQGGDAFVDRYSQGITEEGFLHLMDMYAQKENTETVWLALRKFKWGCVGRVRDSYSNDLEFMAPLPKLKLKSGQSVEFTSEGRIYLITVGERARREA